jgi:exosortase
MTNANTQRGSIVQEIAQELAEIWKLVPSKGLFVSLLAIWLLFFDWFGDPIFGYYHSIFFWAILTYQAFTDDGHGLYMPLIVLGLFWMKRDELKKIQTRLWPPGMLLIVGALVIHLIGYVVQQPRISLMGLFLGLYGIIGVVWGPGILKASFFPMCLFAFAVPISQIGEAITFPLRVMATKITTFLAGNVLGIDLIREGTRIFDKQHTFEFEVAAACSGLRSLTAVAALCTIYAFMNVKGVLRILIMIAAAFPLAIIGNILRLLTLIIVSEAFGRKTGEMVHESTAFSLLPYVPAIVGIVVLGYWLGDKPPKTTKPEGPVMPLGQPA